MYNSSPIIIVIYLIVILLYKGTPSYINGGKTVYMNVWTILLKRSLVEMENSITSIQVKKHK